MGEKSDIVIIGGAVVGSATAYYLRKHGFAGRIVVVEKDPTYSRCCTTLSLGGIRQQFSTPENIRLSQFGLALLGNLKQEFGADADVNYREQGYLIMASKAGVDVLAKNVEIQRQHGASTLLLEGPELAGRFPWINFTGVAAAAFGPEAEGWLDPYSLMTLLRKAAIARGAEWRTGEVTAIERSANTVTAVQLADGSHIECDIIINAAGAGAGQVAAHAGIELPVGPRKRYVYVFDCRAAGIEISQGPLTVDVSGAYMRPEGGQFVCGISPAEADEPETLDFEIDYSQFEDQLWPIWAERIPVFEAIKVTNAWVGHYDYNALDQNAVMGRHPEVGNFIFANGFSGHGLQQAPAAGNAIAELIVDGSYRTIDLERFGYQRIVDGKPLPEVNVI